MLDWIGLNCERVARAKECVWKGNQKHFTFYKGTDQKQFFKRETACALRFTIKPTLSLQSPVLHGWRSPLSSTPAQHHPHTPATICWDVPQHPTHYCSGTVFLWVTEIDIKSITTSKWPNQSPAISCVILSLRLFSVSMCFLFFSVSTFKSLHVVRSCRPPSVHHYWCL